MDITAVAGAIDELIAAGPQAVSDAASMVELRRQLARLESVVAGATDAFDTSGGWAPDGAQSCAAWVAWATHVPHSAARRQLRLGRSLHHLGACARAWSEGSITGAHVGVIAAARTPATAEALERDEALLVDAAKTLRFEAFVKVVAYWAQRADPDGTEDDERRRHGRRSVSLSPSLGGMWFGSITLDPVSGTIVAGELERLERTLFEADWARARERLGHEPTIFDLERTPAQRRADALVEMATRSRAMPPDARRPSPLFSVLVGYETLNGPVCELASGTVVAPGALLPWLDAALLERVVFAPPNRVEVSEKVRLFAGATRRAIEVRDRSCTHPTCDVGAEDCQVDHIIPYSCGGPTTQDNGRLLCAFHNRLRHTRAGP